MAESRTIETLEKKRNEILRAIAGYEEKIGQAQADLAHINATISIFGASYDGEATRPYVNLAGLFKRGEMVAIAKAALADGPLNTRQLSAAVLKAKGLDPGDKVLAKAIGHRLIQWAAATGARRQNRRRRPAQGGQDLAATRAACVGREGPSLWRLPRAWC
jgi:hypothetical protein